jgi:predicted nucleic acid-binding Zn ribbon protein
MITCPRCGEKYPEWRTVCPKCGALPVPEKESKRSPLVLYLAVTALVIVVAVAYILFIFLPSAPSQPITPPQVQETASGASGATGISGSLNQPPAFAAISATKQPNGKITISVSGGTDLYKVASFEVRLNNNVIPASLSPNIGASMVIDGTKEGTDHLVVVAKGNDGTDTVALTKDL